MSNNDVIITLGHSRVQHGPNSDRVYLMHLDPSDYPGIVGELVKLAKASHYSKIFAKVPASLTQAFAKAGFVTEALAPDFFPTADGKGRESGYFMARFFESWRQREENPGLVLDVLRTATVKGREGGPKRPPKGWTFERLKPEEAGDMAKLYSRVFATYPFPIHDPAYIRETMESHVIYFGLRQQGELMALASCETDEHTGLVEMTDFATDREARGAGIAYHLLAHMDRRMTEAGFRTAYTIARAVSYGMNITFARRGYSYAGTLMRNTNISGALESMNVWCKPLADSRVLL